MVTDTVFLNITFSDDIDRDLQRKEYAERIKRALHAMPFNLETKTVINDSPRKETLANRIKHFAMAIDVEWIPKPDTWPDIDKFRVFFDNITVAYEFACSLFPEIPSQIDLRLYDEVVIYFVIPNEYLEEVANNTERNAMKTDSLYMRHFRSAASVLG